jgi:mono/diheme cytochrome c family protein
MRFLAVRLHDFIAGSVLACLLAIYAVVAHAQMRPQDGRDLANGRTMFFAGGCASCHAAPASDSCEDPKIKDKFVLSGGRCLKTEFGTFFVPNISSDKENGIGGWTDAQFVRAMREGISPDGEHYYPAFPYTSYQRMHEEDLRDLRAFLNTLPPSDAKDRAHDLSFPFDIRQALAVWKWLFLDGAEFKPDPEKSEKLNRGAYLVEGPGHCAECHSPRNMMGGIVEEKRYSGGPNPDGEGVIPNITPHKTGIADWSENDIVTALETGLMPSFDSFGGSMVKVQEAMAQLSAEDRQAIAAYLKSLPPLPSSVAKKDKQ